MRDRVRRFYRPARLPRISRRRFAAIGVIAVFALLVGNYLFSDFGLRNLLIQKRTEDRLEGELAALKSRKSALIQYRGALEKDPVAIEKLAREKYLLAREGEMTYVFVPVDSSGAPLPPAASLSSPEGN